MGRHKDVATHCSACGTELRPDRRRNNRCYDCINAVCRRRKKTDATKASKLANSRLTAQDRLQVQACKMYFRQFVVNHHMSCAEAFLRAVCHTDDLHMAKALADHQDEIEQWTNKNFEIADTPGRHWIGKADDFAPRDRVSVCLYSDHK